MPQLPPEFMYAVGALLVVAGAWRAYHFGWKRQDDMSKRHKRYGVIWVVMGLGLIVSTIIQLRRR
jgi:hypothetical protein